MQEGDTVTRTIYDGREPRRGTVTKVTDSEAANEGSDVQAASDFGDRPTTQESHRLGRFLTRTGHFTNSAIGQSVTSQAAKNLQRN